MPRSSRLSIVVISLFIGGTTAAACSSSPTKGHSSTPTSRSLPKTLPTSLPKTSAPPTTAPPRSAPPIQAAGVEIQISGSNAIIQFTNAAVTGTLSTASPAFSSGGKQFGFTITGVTYTGGTVTTNGPPTNRIAQVIVTKANGGVNVQVSLNKSASNDQFTTTNNQVTVSLS